MVRTPVLSFQLPQQRLRLLEIRRVKAFREPAIEQGEELVGLCALTLLLPQTAEAHGGAQFPRRGLLLARHGEGLLETGVRLRRIRDCLLTAASPSGAETAPPRASRTFVVSSTARTSASTTNPLSGWPPVPYASASRLSAYGWYSVDPVARLAANP